MNFKHPATYIMANKKQGTIYTGVTNNLIHRVYQHRNSLTDGFSRKYKCKFLVYYEIHEDIQLAIQREKQIKKFSRHRKFELIEGFNPEWNDLYEHVSN